ncbi:MAG TPA: hypothetical protein VG820_04685, partial [Fimbriimonadaceae bacterium]|nr:hypothetical protein [Fimbriimonadaceae bacterium]
NREVVKDVVGGGADDFLSFLLTILLVGTPLSFTAGQVFGSLYLIHHYGVLVTCLTWISLMAIVALLFLRAKVRRQRANNPLLVLAVMLSEYSPLIKFRVDRNTFLASVGAQPSEVKEREFAESELF